MKDREETHEQAQAEPEVCAETPGQVTSEKPAEVCAETPGQVTPEKPVEDVVQVSAQSPLIAQDQADYAQGDDQALSNALQGALSQAPAHSQSNACEAKQQA
eukprot:s1149_g19.t1